jgi:hypothetical protein
MPSFSREAFIQTLALGGGSVLTAGLGQRALGQTGPETVELKSDNFTLSLQVGEHGLLVCHLVHVPSGTVLADGPYSYTFGPLALSLAGHDGSSATIKGTTTGGLELTHQIAEDLGLKRCPHRGLKLERSILIPLDFPMKMSLRAIDGNHLAFPGIALAGGGLLDRADRDASIRQLPGLTLGLHDRQ